MDLSTQTTTSHFVISVGPPGIHTSVNSGDTLTSFTASPTISGNSGIIASPSTQPSAPITTTPLSGITPLTSTSTTTPTTSSSSSSSTSSSSTSSAGTSDATHISASLGLVTVILAWMGLFTFGGRY